VHTARDGADKVGHGYSGVDECEGCAVYAGLQGSAVLLEDLDVDVDLGARVEVCANDGFECGFYGGCCFEDSPCVQQSVNWNQ
jgi:hypothetical protein